MDNADTNYQPGVDLPKPQYEGQTANLPEQNADNQTQKAETASNSSERPQTSQAPPVPASVTPSPILPPIAPPLPIVNVSNAQSLAPDVPELAEDSDLIEQEWVNKAKAIVERTREDPHLQNKEINKFKADYIKKRYNREIKVSEE